MPLPIIHVERFVPGAAQRIFDVLADPSQHPVIDGSGSVRRAHAGNPARLALGTRFGMDMRIGARYHVTNRVVEFSEGRQIAWRHFNGHVWRYILEPVEGGTRVREEWDPSRAGHHVVLRLIRAPSRNRAGMARTLDNLATRFAGPPV